MDAKERKHFHFDGCERKKTSILMDAKEREHLHLIDVKERKH
jgi:hypothetical protein